MSGVPSAPRAPLSPLRDAARGASLALALMVGAPARAEAPSEPETSVSFEPLGAIYARAFAFEVEQRLAPGWSLALGPAVIVASQAVSGADGGLVSERALVGSLSLGVRRFIGGDGLSGLFLGPRVTFSFGGFTEPSGGLPCAVAAGGLLGYTFLLGRTFLLSTGLGADYHRRLDGDGGDRLLPLLRLAVGAAF
jgi:hypothetical protein